MRVKMLQTVAGRPSYTQGQIVDLQKHIAIAWIADGIATSVEPFEPAPAGQPQ